MTQSPLDKSYLVKHPVNYDGKSGDETGTAEFDAKLCEAAMMFRPAGCPDKERIRVLFTVDFNDNAKDGNCSTPDRKWVTMKPGKSMFITGAVHKESPFQSAEATTLLGGGAPNQIAMYDDGKHGGDRVAGDNIWTVYIDLPIDPTGKAPLRIWYKYTWGKLGDGWTGTEEWPGNSRILEVVDDSGDGFVYRRDVFADEASNKDVGGRNGTVTWTTIVHDCDGKTPEPRENRYNTNECKCDSKVPTPRWIGALTRPCTKEDLENP